MELTSKLKPLWFCLGLLSTVLGFIGIFLPLLPTTPFLLLAAFGFSKSSPRLHNWLITHPVLGSPIKNWQENGAISARSKTTAIGIMLATPLLTYGLGGSGRVIIIQIIVLSCAALFILTRPSV